LHGTGEVACRQDVVEAAVHRRRRVGEVGGPDGARDGPVEDVGLDAVLIESLRALPAKPRVLVCLPMPAFKATWGINDETIVKELTPILRQTAFEAGTELVDLHTPFLDKQSWFADNIHPSADGAALMARIIGSVVGLKPDAALDIEKSLAALALAAKVSSFYGYRRLEFTMDGGRQCTVVRPYVTAAGRPYAWRGEFFGHEPQTDLALVERGYHVVYVGAQDMFGGPIPSLTPKLSDSQGCPWGQFNHSGRRGLSGVLARPRLLPLRLQALPCHLRPPRLGGRILRCRECRHCGKRVTTWEKTCG